MYICSVFVSRISQSILTVKFHHLTGSMSDLWISVAINVIKGLVFVFDVITYIPRYVIEQPYKKLALSARRRVCFFEFIYC